MNSVNFVFNTGHIVGWECYNLDCNYIITRESDLTMMAYNYDFKAGKLKDTTVYQVPGFNAATIIPTYKVVTDPIYKNSTVRGTGMCCFHQMADQNNFIKVVSSRGYKP